MDKNISVIIVPHDNAKTLNFRFSYKLLYTFSVFLVILIVTVLVFVFTYGRMLVSAHQMSTLTRENEALKHQAAQIDSLRYELLNLHAQNIQIKGMLGVNMNRDDSLLVANFSPSGRSSTAISDETGAGVGEREQKQMLDAMPSLWPVRGYTTRGFRVTGGEKDGNYHPGIDIAAARNTPVKAAGEGLVVTSTYDETFGHVVEIDHGYGIYSLYGHNDRNLVKVGDRVARGDPIAFLGSTGNSTAPHLHFEIKKDGIPVDPMKYLLDD